MNPSNPILPTTSSTILSSYSDPEVKKMHDSIDYSKLSHLALYNAIYAAGTDKSNQRIIIVVSQRIPQNADPSLIQLYLFDTIEKLVCLSFFHTDLFTYIYFPGNCSFYCSFNSANSMSRVPVCCYKFEYDDNAASKTCLIFIFLQYPQLSYKNPSR